jgi:hypothetical protein
MDQESNVKELSQNLELQTRQSKGLKEDLDFKISQIYTLESEISNTQKELKEISIQKGLITSELTTIRAKEVNPDDLLEKLVKSE